MPVIHAGVSCPRACMGNMIIIDLGVYPVHIWTRKCYAWFDQGNMFLMECGPPGQTWARVSI